MIRRAKPRSGTAALEFVVVLPLLMTLILGCIDFGRFAHYYIAVSNAARTGADLAAANPFTPATKQRWQDAIRREVETEMSSVGGFDAAKLSLTTTVHDEGTTDQRTVVAVGYPFTMVINWPAIPNSVTLRHTAIARQIRP